MNFVRGKFSKEKYVGYRIFGGGLVTYIYLDTAVAYATSNSFNFCRRARQSGITRSKSV